MGYITTGIGFDIDLWNEMEHIRLDNGIDSRSQYIQMAVRRLNKSMVAENVKNLLDKLSEKDIEYLKKEIKKRG